MNGKGKKYSVGRAPENDLVLADDSVSRKHAELIMLGDGKILLVDCKSSNGTFVVRGNGPEKINQKLVSIDDVVIFGEMKIVLREILEKFNENSINEDAPRFDPARGYRLVRCICGAIRNENEKCRGCGR